VNRYIGNTGRFFRVNETLPDTDVPDSAAEKAASRFAAAGAGSARTESARAESKSRGGLGFTLPFGLELSELVLPLLFFFLYLETRDEEFLIILAALVFFT
jgi:hypothetical protein